MNARNFDMQPVDESWIPAPQPEALPFDEKLVVSGIITAQRNLGFTTEDLKPTLPLVKEVQAQQFPAPAASKHAWPEF